VRARELVETLKGVKSSVGFQVLTGKKVVEARPVGATKGNAASHWIERVRPDFVLAAGDDATDEDLFAALPASAWSIRIGLEDSKARFNLEDPERLRSLLEDLAATDPAGVEVRPG
jgi:trehalose 6-phosphate synthase/phosphatase